MKIVKAIGASIGVVLCFFYLGCGSIPMVAAGVPNIDQIVPAPLIAGTQGTILKIVGSNFDSGSKVLWNGTELSTTVVDSNTLSSPIESANLAVPGVVQLAVKNVVSGRTSPAFKVAVTSGASSSISISPASLPAGSMDSPYSVAFTATGGTAPYTWSVGSGKLPAGLALDATTGTLSGTPTTSGSFTFSIAASDSSTRALSKSASYSLTVTAMPLAVGTASLPNGTANASYSQTLTATGGSPNYHWSVVSGSLPPGLSLSPPRGTISGTPTASGTYSFTTSVKDSENPAQTASKPLSITVIAPAAPALQITSTSIPSATSGAAFSTTLAATGGTTPYRWSLSSGSLPAGITLSSAGILSGTTTGTGTFNFVASVSDNSSPVQTQTVSLSLVVSATTLKVMTNSLPNGTSGAGYSQALQATGGTPTYKWGISSGSLPPGLALNQSTGAISGTPNSSGTSTFTATVADSTNPSQTASSTLSITTTAPALAITSPSLPSLGVGTTYSQQLQATGGTSPYSWSLASGSLPPGVTLSSSGLISGSVSSATSSYTYTFTVKVQDVGSPAQSATASASIALLVNASALGITSSTLPSGTSGIGYSASLLASGGTPGYTWKITTGSLPPGLSLAATTGVISGTPSISGTTSLTVSVSDNGNPVQVQSANTSIVIASAAPAAPIGPGTTWFIRPDGGTRYSANVTNGQCDGQSDASYAGTGTNQHCAFNDVRYMWMDGTYGNSAWVMAGGDTLVIRGCAASPYQQNPDAPHCRIGWDKATGNDAQNFWCAGVNAWWGCSMPPPPSGTAGQHTRIFGACAYGTYTCSPVSSYPYTSNNLTQLFGGFGTGAVMYMNGSKYVDVEGLEITSHNAACTRVGAPQYPKSCSNSVPVDDFARHGIDVDNTSSNITLQDLYIHGLAETGIGGPVGGPFTLTRVSIDFNAFAGWNFDTPGSPTNAPGSSVTQSYVTMIGNGCLEEYPIVHTQFPAKACWDIGTAGFGDAWSGQPSLLDSFTCDHCNISYNAKDGAMGPHTLIHNISLTNSIWIGNMGQNEKWGQDANSTFVFQNNVVVGNCNRMSQALPGAAQNFNINTGLYGSYLTTFCRAAGDLFAFFADAGSSVNINNNTFVTYQATIFDLSCNTANNCASAPYRFTNNLFLGYTSPTNPVNPGQAPGLYYKSDASVVVSPSNNLQFGIRNGSACGTNGIVCSDPLVVNEPAQGTVPPETALDNFNFHPSNISPAIGAGTVLSGLTTDYYGTARAAPPTIGAVEP